MENEELFKLILNEDVVLFVGAGFSLYADYPNGPDLAKIIYSKLSEEDKNYISETDNLSELTENIYHLKNQNNELLIECLKDIFEKEPPTYHVHKLLSEIPHFKKIITTNYDKLFEYGFKHEKKFQIIKSSRDIPTIKSDHIKLYKIHGDLDNPDAIILKKSDYENYFSDNAEKSIFWNSVKDLLAKHHVLFIGYSLQDININVIFDKISKELKESRKKAFFVSPNIDKVGKSRLNAMNIEFIESNGEDTLNALSDYLKESYFPTLRKVGGNTNTALDYGENNNLSLSINKNRNGSLDFDKVKPMNSKIPLKLNLKFDLQSSSLKQAQIKRFLNGEISELALETGDFSNGSLFANDIKLADDIVNIIALKPPFFNDKITFEFADGYESSEFNLKASILNKPGDTIEMRFEFLGYDFTIINFGNGNSKSKKPSQFTIKATPIKPISNVRNGIDLYEIFMRVINSVPFNVYSANKLQYSNNAVSSPPSEEIQKIAELLEYFKNLKKIERAFSLKFSEIDLNKLDFEQVNNIVAHVERKAIPTTQIDFAMNGSQCSEFIQSMDKYKDETIIFKRIGETEVEYDLHQEKINIGHSVYLMSDVEIIQDSFDENGILDRIIITNTDKKAYISFQKDVEPNSGFFLLHEDSSKSDKQ